MAAINQRIPNFSGGISQQDDTSKFPGQLRVCDNAVPDITFGLMKRPPAEYVNKLANANATGQWFEILRDGDEKYLIQITPANTGAVPIRVWDLADGTEKTVSNGSGDSIYAYLSGATDSYAIQTIQDYTIIANPQKTVASTGRTNSLLHSGEYSFARLDTIAYNTEYVLYSGATIPDNITYYRVTGLEVQKGTSDGNTWDDSNEDSRYAGLGQFSFSGGNNHSLPNTAGTYGRSGTTITITASSHGYKVSDIIVFDATAGAATDGTYVVKTVPDANTLTIHDSASGTISTGTSCTIRTSITDVEGFVTVNAQAYINSNTANYDSDGSGQATDFLGYTQDYNTRYTAAVTLKDGGIIKTSNYDKAIAQYLDLTIEGQSYRVKVVSVEPVTTYEGVTNIGFYKSPKNPDKGKASMANILKGLHDSVNADLTNVTAEVIGSGLFLYGSNAENINFLGGAINEGMTVIGKTTQDISRLPAQCKHGYITQVSNVENVDTDNYYVKFLADDGVQGPGKWEECARPHDLDKTAQSGTYTRSGTTITVTFTSHGHSVNDKVYLDFTSGTAVDGLFTVASVPSANTFTVVDTTSGTISSSNVTITTDYVRLGLDPATMPHALVNNRDGTFTFKKLDLSTAQAADNDNYWKDRVVGDKTTNPFPTFLGKNIQEIFFHRNRLGLIADEQVVLSRPSDYFNFFIVSSIATSDDNPVDITVSDLKPAFIHHALANQKGVALFSDNAQFLLFTESDIFSPSTARIKKVSSYECDPTIDPVDLGVSLLFVNTVAAYSRAYEIAIVDDDVPPKIDELTRVAPEYIPSDITLVTNSTGLGITSYAKKGSSNFYHYKLYNVGNRRPQSAFYSWTVTGAIQHAVYTGGKFYTVTLQGSTYILSKHEYITDATAGTSYTLGGTSSEVGDPLKTARWFEACLDTSHIPASSDISYTPQGGHVTGPSFTDVTLPYPPTSADDFYLVALAGTDSDGSSVAGTVIKANSVYPTKATFENVDLTGWTIACGYKYTTTIEMPIIYLDLNPREDIVNYDTDADLRISGINFNMGVGGPIEFHLSSTMADMADITQTDSGMLTDSSVFSSPPADLHKRVRVPIQRKNDKYNLTIKIPDPFSTSIVSATWDGRYDTRRHARR